MEDIDFTFRLQLQNPYFGGSMSSQLDLLDEVKRKTLVDFIEKNFSDNIFMSAQKEYLLTGNMPLMTDSAGKIICSAGENSMFVNSHGDFFPCMNSVRKIGDFKKGITQIGYTKGDLEGCPCCSECQYYPTHFFGENNDE